MRISPPKRNECLFLDQFNTAVAKWLLTGRDSFVWPLPIGVPVQFPEQVKSKRGKRRTPSPIALLKDDGKPSVVRSIPYWPSGASGARMNRLNPYLTFNTVVALKVCTSSRTACLEAKMNLSPT